ncbi:MAG: DNA repair and recombination protein RadA [Candidatus Aenigmatarchaeota archaeon]|nr:DNA repair and recombination protein RadA [Candidatus Aenigmarchaeota archaeon]
MGKEKEKIKSISDLPGVGEKTAEKLMDAGYTDLMSIAAASPKELSEIAEIGEQTAAKIIIAARDALEMGYETALKVFEKREKIGKITTGSKSLNEILGGGIETGAITEFHGAFGSSKSQIAHQLSVNVQLPKDKGGLEGACLFIDTEGTFRPERIKQMAEALNLDPNEVLKNIYVARAYNSDHQCLLVEKAGEIVKEKNIKLIVVDSVTALFRAEFTGRGELANRQQKLNKHLHSLQRLADVYNVAVYITNQVMARPDILFGDPTAPIGGHILGHFSTYRVYVRKSKGDTRIARIIDSPNLPEAECVFRVTSRGIEDVEEN